MESHKAYKNIIIVVFIIIYHDADILN